MTVAAAGVRPGWLGYVSVADVDASVAGIDAAHASVAAAQRYQ